MLSDLRLYFVSVLQNISVSVSVSLNEIIYISVSISVSVNEYNTGIKFPPTEGTPGPSLFTLGAVRRRIVYTLLQRRVRLYIKPIHIVRLYNESRF